MINIKVLPNEELCPNGTELKYTSSEKINLCKFLLKNNIAIEHACDMVCACTTCHVIIHKGYQELLNSSPLDELEEDLLDRAWGITAYSRLSCQIQLDNNTAQDIVIEIPKYTINHAKEK